MPFLRRPLVRRVALSVVALVGTACAAGPPEAASPPGLAGSSWRLVEFQSSDDQIGTLRPSDPSLYTMTLAADGTVAMRLDCNRGSGTWTSTPTSDEGGAIAFGPLAVTRAFCPQPSLDQQIARQAEYIRSYILRGGRLYLSLMADGGIYVWEPSPG